MFGGGAAAALPGEVRTSGLAPAGNGVTSATRRPVTSCPGEPLAGEGRVWVGARCPVCWAPRRWGDAGVVDGELELDGVVATVVALVVEGEVLAEPEPDVFDEPAPPECDGFWVCDEVGCDGVPVFAFPLLGVFPEPLPLPPVLPFAPPLGLLPVPLGPVLVAGVDVVGGGVLLDDPLTVIGTAVPPAPPAASVTCSVTV